MKKTPFIILLFSLSIVFFTLFSCGGNDIIVKWQSPQEANSQQGITLKVYMENSGSMNGYMCDSSELKDAVKSYVSSLDTYVDSINLNYINTKIIDCGNDIKKYISTMNPSSFAKAGGDTKNSDISDMFDMILKSNNENEVSLFISDCIMDVPEGDATHFFTNRQIDIRNSFKKYMNGHKDLGVEIIRLSSIYKGMYYYYKGGEKIESERPYFMFVIGNKNILSDLNKKVPLTEIKHGYKNFFAFSTPKDVPFEITNKFGTLSTKKGECVSKASNGESVFNIKLNLSSTLQDDKIICNVNNYNKIGSGLTITSISPVKDTKSSFTHVMNIAINDGTKPYGEMIELKALPTPEWLEAVNDDSGKNINENIEKTTGIKYIIGGITDAYKDIETTATIKFTVGIK